MRKIKNKIIVLMLPIFIMSILFTTSINAEGRSESQDTGNMIISKTATAVEEKPREFEIELKIKPIPQQVKKPADIIVVVDTSGSMTQNINGRSRIELIKENIEKVYNDITGEIYDTRFSLISFDGRFPGENDSAPKYGQSKVEVDFGEDFLQGVDSLTDRRNNSDGATNTHMAMKRVQEQLTKVREEATPYVIFFTDGVPTINSEANTIDKITYNPNSLGIYKTQNYNAIDGSEIKTYTEDGEQISYFEYKANIQAEIAELENQNPVNNNKINILKSKIKEPLKQQYKVNSADAAKRVYDQIVNEYENKGIKFYTVGSCTDYSNNANNISTIYNIYGKDYNDAILAREFITYIQNIYDTSDYTQYPYYVESGDEEVRIKEVFESIVIDIIDNYNAGGNDVVIQDIVTEYFEMIDGTYTAWIPGEKGQSDIQISSDKFTVDVNEEENKVRFMFDEVGPRGVIVKFHIKPTNDYFGGNHIYTNEEAKLYYKDIVTGEDKEQTFNVPYVDLDFIHGKITAVKNIKGDVEPSKYNKTTFPITIKGGEVEKSLGAELIPYEEQQFDFILVDKDTIILDDEYNEGNKMNFLYIGDYNVKELVPMNYKLEGITINGITSNDFIINKDNPNIHVVVTNSITNNNYFYDQDKTPNKFGQLITKAVKGE